MSLHGFYLGCSNEDYMEEEDTRGYACHACYNLLQRQLNYTLKYADVLPLLIENDYTPYNSFWWSDYGGLADYYDEFLFEARLVKDGKLWMVEDPSRNEQNKERILRVWRPLVESGFQRPDHDAKVEDGSRTLEIAERIGALNLDESKA